MMEFFVSQSGFCNSLKGGNLLLAVVPCLRGDVDGRLLFATPLIVGLYQKPLTIGP